MHIAFDGGCFQQGILGGIYHVACGFLNAAKLSRPELRVTLVCDSRQGEVREEALAGLTWRPETVYAPVAVSYDEPERWPVIRDPAIRFLVDGRIEPAFLSAGKARYRGPRPEIAFVILSRTAAAAIDDNYIVGRGIRIEDIMIASSSGIAVRIEGDDRRLRTGFIDAAGRRWTDGAGFVPLALFPKTGDGDDGEVLVEVNYTPQDEYALPPGPSADAIRLLRRQNAVAERKTVTQRLADDLRADGCSVYFANHFTPIALPGLINVAWAYDLIPILFPQYFHADARLNFDENLRVFLAAERVYAISEATRSDLIAHDVVAPDRVIAASIAASESFFFQPAAKVAMVLAAHGFGNEKYIITVATIEPRKNHFRLLIAYAELRRRLPDCPRLLMVGKVGWDVESVMQFRMDAGLEDAVSIISDVAEDDLVALYSGALFSVYVSVYEGFGLPIVEAMSVGCPVLTSDRSSMAEVAGDAAELVDPYDIDAIVKAMCYLATDEKRRAALSERGIQRAALYRWDKTAEAILSDLAVLHGLR